MLPALREWLGSAPQANELYARWDFANAEVGLGDYIFIALSAEPTI